MKDNSKEDTNWVLALFAIPTLILIGLILLIPLALFNAWVSLTLYNWFLSPLGAPSLNIWHMWGIMLLISRFTPTPEYKEEESAAKVFGKLAAVILGGLLALLIGYFVKGMI